MQLYFSGQCETFISPIEENVFELDVEIILQTQRSFLFLSSLWPHFNCLLKWTIAWHFCKLLPSSSLLSLPPLPLLSSLPSFFLLPLFLIHIHVWCCLWAAINHVSRASSQKGEASTLDSLSAPCALPGKPFQRTQSRGGLQRGWDSRESEWERYGEAGKGGKRRLHFRQKPPSPTVNIGASCIWFLS